MGFESGVLRTLAENFPKQRKALLSIVERLVDPLPTFRSFVYDPEFKGSFSIKDVAPAILGKGASYSGLIVGDGHEAQAAYLEMINASTGEARKAELRKSLIEYCRKDTKCMVDLVEWLFKKVQ